MSASERISGESGISREEQWRIHQLVARCRKGLEAVLDRELRPLGISAVELGILDALYATKDSGRPSTPTQLGLKVVRRHNSVVSSLLAMERAGLVCLKKKAPGRRTMEVGITARGEEVYGEALRATRSAAEIIGTLTQNQRQQLTTLLEKLDQAIVDSLHGMH
jgi:DNA-binding MarR family transcriptional regulator